MSGVKDLDLAVKEDPRLAAVAGDVLVLTDVPASFVIVPPSLAAAATPLIAQPPLPPSGAYRFGAARVVGLARRGRRADAARGPGDVSRHSFRPAAARSRAGRSSPATSPTRSRRTIDAEGLDDGDDAGQD